MKKLFFILLAVCTMTANAQMEQMMQQLPTDPGTRIGKLENGLTYYLRNNKYPEGQADFYIAQKVGSALEEDNQRGLAHFLEHMCFNGTKNYPGNGVISYLETIGVKFGEQLNAYTSVEETVYNINNVPTAREATIDSVLLILHDWSHDLTLDPVEIDKERGVIHEEWRSRSSAIMRIYERQLPKMMNGARSGSRLPIGTMEVVDNFPPEALRAYYEKWYRPDQQAIIVVGDLDIDHVEAKIKEMFGNIAMPENPAAREYEAVPDNAQPIVVVDKDVEMTIPVVDIMMKHEGAPREMRNTIAYLISDLMTSAACDMLNLRLKEMGQDPGVPYIQANVGYDNFVLSKVTDCLEMEIIPKEGKLNEAVTDVMKEVYRAAKYGFNASEYGRWRSEFLSQVQAMYDNKDKRKHPSFIDECVKNFIDGEAMPGLEMEYQLYNAILPQIPVDVVNQTFAELVLPSDSNLVVCCFNPEKNGYVLPTEQQLLDAIHEAQQAELEAYVDETKNEPLIPELPKLGKIKKDKVGPFGTRVWTLSNGVRVISKQTDFKDNEIVMTAYSEGGTSRYKMEDRFTLELLPELISASGLGNFTHTELSKALAGKQANVSPAIGPRSEALTGNAVPVDLRTMFELIYLHFQPLKRDDKSAASVMMRQAETLRNQAADPMHAFSDSIQSTIYNHHPRLVLLKEQDLDKVSYDRALEIYADRFADASDFTFYFVGNFDPDSLRLYSQQYLANLPVRKRNDACVDNKFTLADGTRECIFSKEMQQPQCTLIELLHAPEKFNLKSDLLVDITSEVLSMRLLETVREEMGAAYSIGASGNIMPTMSGTYRSAVQIYAPVKPEMLDTCRQVIDQELQAIATNGADEKYLQKIKEYLIKTFKEQERNNSAWLKILINKDRDNMDAYTGYEYMVNGITSKDVSEYAARLLKAGNKNTIAILPEQK